MASNLGTSRAGDNCRWPAVGRLSRQTRRSRLQQLAEAGVTRSADRHLRAVSENREPAVLGVELDAAQAIEVDDERAVDSNEVPRVEPLLEGRQPLRLEVGPPTGVDRDRVIASLDVVDRVGRDDPNLAAVTDQDPFGPPLSGPRGGRYLVQRAPSRLPRPIRSRARSSASARRSALTGLSR